MYLCVDLSVCMLYPKKPEEGVRFPGAGVETVVRCLRWMLEQSNLLSAASLSPVGFASFVRSKSRETVIALVTFL